MNEKLMKFEQERLKTVKNANYFYIFGVLLILLGLALMFLIHPLLIFVIFIGVILIVVGSSKIGKMAKKFKNEFMPTIIREVYPEASFNFERGLSEEQILIPGFFKRPSRYTTSDYLKASYDDVEFEMSEFDFKERRTTTDGKGHTTTTYVTYAKGRFMIFDFKRDFDKVVKVFETTFLGANTHNLEKVETESIEFNKKFKIYATDELTAFYVLTPQVQLKLLEIEKKFKGSIFFAFMKGKLYIAINDNANTLEMNPKKPINEESLQTFYNQLSIPAAFINELKLSSDKWSKNI